MISFIISFYEATAIHNVREGAKFTGTGTGQSVGGRRLFPERKLTRRRLFKKKIDGAGTFGKEIREGQDFFRKKSTGWGLFRKIN